MDEPSFDPADEDEDEDDEDDPDDDDEPVPATDEELLPDRFSGRLLDDDVVLLEALLPELDEELFSVLVSSISMFATSAPTAILSFMVA